MRFTNFLNAQAVCSASRSALLTGCYPNRIGFAGALFPNAKVGIHADEVTLAVLPHKGRTYLGHKHEDKGFPGKTKEDFSYPQGLYDLRRDPAESYDVQEKYPEIVQELLKVAEQAREDLGDAITEKKGNNRREIGKVE